MSDEGETARRLIRGFDKGMYTRLEILSRLVELAASAEPKAIALVLPPDWIASIAKKTEQLPASPKDVVIISGAILRPGIDPESHDEELRLRYFQGAAKWHAYFAELGVPRDRPGIK
jgi:hypothetical protein